jgi:hypothetical protein
MYGNLRDAHTCIYNQTATYQNSTQHPLKGDVAVLKTDVAVLKSDVTALKTGQAVIAARLDEQRLTINALIPTRLAALPGRPDAAE